MFSLSSREKQQEELLSLSAVHRTKQLSAPTWCDHLAWLHKANGSAHKAAAVQGPLLCET